MRFKPDEITTVLTEEIAGYGQRLRTEEVGRVLEIGDGIARVYGLTGLMNGEMVEFTRTKIIGLAFNLEETSVGIIILGATGDHGRHTVLQCAIAWRNVAAP